MLFRSGYGIYHNTPSTDKICDDGLDVYDYLTKTLRWRESDIIIFGRSIGTGPAIYVASSRNPGMLVLMSAFTCIKDVVRYNACFFSMFIADRLRNIDHISKVKCPKIFIHGKEDTIVPFTLSQSLYITSYEPKKLVIREQMTHNMFDMWFDLILPLKTYWSEINFASTKENYRFKIRAGDNELPEIYQDKFKTCSCAI